MTRFNILPCLWKNRDEFIGLTFGSREMKSDVSASLLSISIGKTNTPTGNRTFPLFWTQDLFT